MTRHFVECGICGAPGHSAKRCPLRAMEERKDPVGEKRRVEELRARGREGRDRQSSEQRTSTGGAQSSPRFGV